MPDNDTPPADGATPDATPESTPAPASVTAEDVAKLQAALDKEREIRKAAEKRAKDYEAEQRAKLTDSERAVAEAKEAGRLEAVQAYGTRLAATEFRAAAAARNPGYDVSKALAYLNLGTFVDEHGEPNGKAIEAAVADLVPEAVAPDGRPRGNADLGPRQTPLPADPRARDLAQIEADMRASARR